MLRLAAFPANDELPRIVAPSRKVTLPVGVPPSAAVTVAVKVTDCWKVEGFALESTEVLVVALTTCVSGAESLARKELSLE